ncbi:MAG: hypothetical protein DRP66_10910 [Planctomycetota bacterium]|mgnify:CR=1 FL=1|nr:MAG: hypothetical protein DRP66_10910 [Planctomycetota bacterium]
MSILRRNTDYALRAMVNLAGHYGGDVVATRQLSAEEDISYQYAAKIMQLLHAAGLVKSTMGSHGGFSLARPPQEVSLLDIIKAVQGAVSLNDCFLDADACPRRSTCVISAKIAGLQEYIEKSLAGITLAEFATDSMSEHVNAPKEK